MSDYPTFAHRWFDQVWNQQKLEAVDTLACPDVFAHGLVDASGQEVRGVDNFKAFYHEFRSAFSDIVITVEDSVTEGDKVVAFCRVKATHSGGGMGLAPTGRPVEFTGLCMMRLRNGQLAEAWNQFDFLGLYQQLGAFKLPKA